MKILIASDIHGSAYYCRSLLERYREEKPDKLLLLEISSITVQGTTCPASTRRKRCWPCSMI